MDNKVFCCIGCSPALEYAKANLIQAGFHFIDTPDTEVSHLLLPIPSFDSCGLIKGGENLNDVRSKLHPNATIIGGNLGDFKGLDLLKDTFYVTHNAYLTAECAIRFAAQRMDLAWKGSNVLVMGWGRIGKCLTKILIALGATVAIAARKEADRALASALGARAVSLESMNPLLSHQDVIFNTIPTPVLTDHQANMCCSDCLLIELASKPGILSDRAIPALGLPGKMVPKSSGRLIADTVIRLTSLKEE